MRTLLFFSILFFSLSAVAQKASFNENSVSYLGKTYKVGDVIHLGYGSVNNKDFAFVNYGKSIGGVNLPGLYHHADADWSKADVEIIKLYTNKGVIWAKCSPVNRGSAIGSALGNKIYINIEAAADNKEITGVEAAKNQTANHSNNEIKEDAPAPVQKSNAPILTSSKKEILPAPPASKKRHK